MPLPALAVLFDARNSGFVSVFAAFSSRRFPASVPARQQHFQWIGNVQKPDAARAIEGVYPCAGSGALLKQGARRRVLCAAGGVVSDFLNGSGQHLIAKGEEV